MAVDHLFASIILLLISNKGFSAGDTVYMETGASVQLDIQRDDKLPEFEELIWQNEKSKSVVKYYNESKKVNQYDPYKGRVDFNTETFSVTLKNLQQTDSGVYTAKITGNTNRDIAEHTVSVLDAVEAPVLTVISNSSSSDHCTVNITCTGHDLTLNSTYTNGRCSPEEVTSQEKYTIILICSGKNIICNHSNPVSWKKYETDITQFCKVPEKPRGHQDTSNPFNSMIGVISCVVLVLFLAALALAGYCWRKRHKGGQQEFNTIYEGVGNQPMETIKPESHTHTYDFPDRTPAQTQEGKESNTIYHLVGQPPNQPVTAVTEHTIYSQVCKQPPAKRPDTTSSNNTRKQTEDCG